MGSNDSFDSEIKNAVTQINRKATDTAPESNWTGILGRSEDLKPQNGIFTIVKNYKIISAAASILLVVLVSTLLVTTLSEGDSRKVKTAESTTTSTSTETSTSSSTVPIEETTVPTSGTNQTVTTKPKAVTTTPTTTPSRPANPSNPQFTGQTLIGSPGDPATYNVYFSWNASATPGVKYCVGTTSEGSPQANVNCDWSYPYLVSGNTTGFGLVFKQNTTYQFQVTAIDSNNQKSDTIYLNWQLQ